jgi:hypothetical protein
MNNPPLKFQVHPQCRKGLQTIADHHGIGGNETSAPEVAKIAATAFSLVRPQQFYLALAALKPFQRTSPLPVFHSPRFSPKGDKKSL